MADGDFVAKLPIGVEIDKNAPQQLEQEATQAIKQASKRLPKIEANIQATNIKNIASEIKELAKLQTLERSAMRAGASNTASGIAVREVEQQHKLWDEISKAQRAGIINDKQSLELKHKIIEAAKTHKLLVEAIAEVSANKSAQQGSKQEVTQIEQQIKSLKELYALSNTNVKKGVTDSAGTAALEKQKLIQQEINRLVDKGLVDKTQATALQNKLNAAIDIQKEKVASIQAQMTSQSDGQVTVLQSKLKNWLDINPNVKDFDALQERIASINKLLAAGDVTQARKEFDALKTSAKQLGATTQTMGQQVAGAIKQFAGIGSVATAVYTAINKLKAAVVRVTELDAAMVDLQIASGKSADEVARMVDEYHDLAKALGATSIEVAQGADGWLRQGYAISETNELIKASTMLAKLGQMETAEATDALTSSMKGFQYGVEEAEGIVDRFAAVDMRAAVSAGYLATAMSKTAVGAKAMGIDFNTLTGAIATVGEVTQESAEVTGNFFKTLIARMGNIKAGNLYDPESAESLSDVETVLNGVGIQLREADGEFRNFWEVLKEVNAEWDNWGSVQQKAVSVAFSGTRQQERFLVLMENFDQVMELAEVSAESFGTAAEKFGAYLDSIGAKSAAFKTAIYDLSDSFVNSELVKTILDAGTGLVTFATALIDTIGPLNTVLLAFGAFKGIKAGAGLLSFAASVIAAKGNVDKLFLSVKGLSMAEAELAVASVTAAGAETTLGASLALLKANLLKTAEAIKAKVAALWGMIAANGVAIGVTGGLVAALAALAVVAIKARKEQDDLTKSIADNSKELKDNGDSIVEYQNQIKENKDLLKELEAIELPSLAEQDEIEAIRVENNELERQIALLDAKNKALRAQKIIDEDRQWELAQGRRNTTKQYNSDGELKWWQRQDVLAPNVLSGHTEVMGEYDYGIHASEELIKNRRTLLELEAETTKATAARRVEITEEIEALEARNLVLESSLGEIITEYQASDNPEAIKFVNVLLGALEQAKTKVEAFNNVIESASNSQIDWLRSLYEEGTLTWNHLYNVFHSSGVTDLKAIFGDDVAAIMDGIVSMMEGTEESIETVSESVANFRDVVMAAGDSLSSLESAIDTALDWRSSTEQVEEAIATIKNLSGIELDIDADNLLDTLQLMKAYIDGDAEAFEEFASTALKSLGIKPDASGIEGVITSLVTNLGTLTGSALTAASAMLALFESIGAVNKIEYDDRIGQARAAGYGKDDLWVGNTRYIINDDWFEQFSNKKSTSSASSSSKSSSSALPEAYQKAVKEIEHLRNMDIISEEEYYRRLSALADKYLKGKSKYLDEYRKVQEQLWAFQKEQYEKQRDDQIKALEDQADAQKKALEAQYDAQREALEKEKDLLDEQKDAYKDLIDYKKSLLEDASDEREHNQRVEELNRDIGEIEAELAAIALDNSAKANARRVELHDELMSKQKELEDEQWDWSVDNQKDALDKEYDRYEKTIDAQTKLLDAQLDALQKSYEAQLDTIESSLQRSTDSLTAYFDRLISNAQNAAAQIQAAFNAIDLSTLEGRMQYQSSMVGSGYDLGNYGSNQDGVDGKLGKMSTKALQQLLNSYQSQGLINFGASLKIDGIVGSKTRAAIAAAISAGLLDESFRNFDKYHVGGIVGSGTDKKVLEQLLPLNRNEVLAKLLKGEMVLTEKQQDMARSTFEKMATMVPIADAANKRMLVDNAGAPTINMTIHNVFEGAVDTTTLQRLENWGERFKKDIFGTMNKHSKFIPKSI